MLAFHGVRLEDREMALSYLRDQPQVINELSFATLFLWSSWWGIKICEQPEALYITSQLPDGGAIAAWQPWLRIGASATETVARVERDMADRGLPLLIKYVSQGFADQLIREGSPYQCQPMREDYDYLYLRNDLAMLQGKKFHGKKNHVNQFNKHYMGQYEFNTLKPEDLEDCLKVYCSWYTGRNDVNVAVERPVIITALSHMQALGLCGGILRVEGTPAAFCVAEILQGNIALVHLEKASVSVEGSYPKINQEFAASLPETIEWINREEDMGIDGMRKAKLSYHPHHLEQKYDITRA